MGEKGVSKNQAGSHGVFPFSCSRRCTPHPFPTPLFPLYALLASLPPTIEKEKKRRKCLALFLCLRFPSGCPLWGVTAGKWPLKPHRSHQCPAWLTNPKTTVAAFPIYETTECLCEAFYMEMLFAVKNIHIHTFLYFSRAEPSLYKRKLPVWTETTGYLTRLLDQTYLGPKHEKWNKTLSNICILQDHINCTSQAITLCYIYLTKHLYTHFLFKQ